MSLVEKIIVPKFETAESDRLKRQLRDYATMISKLVWQRQAIFLAAILLTALYFDPTTTFACYAVILTSELIDLYLARKILSWTDSNSARADRFLFAILANTSLSALGICAWVVLVVHQQGVGEHFMPLFFLFAAALFAGMNNHQVVSALSLRLALYGATFLYIAVRDLWLVSPPMYSNLWLNFFTIVFVLYFIIDCSLVFLRMYRKGLKQLEDLRAEHEKTKVAFKAKSEFLSTVSHELRTPLTSIKGSLDLIATSALGDVPDQARQVLEIAGKNSNRLADLINDLLDLQKIEAGELTFDFQPINVQDLITETVDANKGYADSLTMAIGTNLPDEAIFIEGDKTRLMQVLENLLSNALKFSAAGSNVEIEVAEIMGKVRISVKDEGVGIPENAHDKVFGAFSQVDSSGKRKVGGTGLGLNIAKRIVERHRGVIDYRSVLGEGSVFFVEFDQAIV